MCVISSMSSSLIGGIRMLKDETQSPVVINDHPSLISGAFLLRISGCAFSLALDAPSIALE